MVKRMKREPLHTTPTLKQYIVDDFGILSEYIIVYVLGTVVLGSGIYRPCMKKHEDTLSGIK